MGFGKVKIRKADSVFSNYVRSKAGWKCERCGAQHEEKSQGLHCSHFHGRRKESTRFDETNVASLCHGCHSYFHGNPLEHTEWFKKRIGEREFDLLTLRANTYHKKDDTAVIMVYTSLLKELNE